MKKDLENDFDAQMMLELYIHDYLVRNNLHTVAETFSQEANFQPKPVAVDGLLSDWWSVFWNVYRSRPGNDPAASTSMPHQSCAGVPPNPDPVSPMPDPNYIVQNLDPMLSAGTFDPMLNTLDSPPSHDMLAQVPNLPQAEAETGSVGEPFWRNLDHLLNALNSPSRYDPTLEQLPNLPQAETEMGSGEEPFRQNLEPTLNALNSPSPYDPALAQLPDMPQAETEMGSGEEPFMWNVLEPTLNAISSPSPYDPTLPQLPNLSQAEAETGSVDEHLVHVRKPPRNPDPAIKATADSHQFSLRPEMGSSSYHINNWQQSPTVSRPHQSCASNAHPVSQPPDPNISLPSVEELDPMINAVLNSFNSLPPYDPTLANLPNLPQAEIAVPRPDMEIPSSLKQRVDKRLQNRRRRARNNETCLRRPNT